MAKPLVRWEDPGESYRRQYDGKHREIAKALRQRPGEWAVVLETANNSSGRSMVVLIKRGRMPAYLPAGAFESKSRARDGVVLVYARYVGEVQP